MTGPSSPPAPTTVAGNEMNISDLLEIIRNQETYAKRIEELNRIEQEIKSATLNLTKAKDIDAALTSAKKLEETSNAVLRDAREKHQRMVDEAQASAANIVFNAQMLSDKVTSEAKDKQNELDVLKQQINTATKQLDAYQRDIANAKTELARVTSRSSELREQLQKKQQQLKELLSA